MCSNHQATLGANAIIYYINNMPSVLPSDIIGFDQRLKDPIYVLANPRGDRIDTINDRLSWKAGKTLVLKYEVLMEPKKILLFFLNPLSISSVNQLFKFSIITYHWVAQMSRSLNILFISFTYAGYLGMLITKPVNSLTLLISSHVITLSSFEYA